MISDPDDFFTKGCGRCDRFATPDCSTRLWIDGLNTLRRICFDMGLQETVKWGHPCYRHAGRNIALFGPVPDMAIDLPKAMILAKLSHTV